MKSLEFLVWPLLIGSAVVSCGGDDDPNPATGGAGGGGATAATGGAGGTGGSGGSGAAAGGTGGVGGASGGTAGAGGGAGIGGAGAAPAELAQIVPLSATLEDRLWAVQFDGQARVVGAGFVAVDGTGPDTQVAVARFTPAGALDATFGTAGVAVHNVKVGGNVETARDLKLQADGKIVVCGVVEHDPTATEPDADGFVLRLDATGAIDTTFGTSGVALVDFGAGGDGASDLLWSCDLDAQDRIVLFASKKQPGSTSALRDRVIARLSKDGAVDTTFATAGFFTLDVDGLALNDNARHGFVQADGKIFSAGYTPIGGQNEIVLVRLNDDGTPDTTFGGDGVVRHNPLSPGMTEAYAAVTQSDGKYVTTGYGRSATSGQVDLVAFRYSAAGVPDTTWGAGGGFLYDITGDNDRGRFALALAGNRILHVGSGSPSASTLDAMVLINTPSGALDTSFNPGGAEPGVKLYDFGTADEAFFGAAISPGGDWLAAVGYANPGGTQTADSVLLLLPL